MTGTSEDFSEPVVGAMKDFDEPRTGASEDFGGPRKTKGGFSLMWPALNQCVTDPLELARAIESDALKQTRFSLLLMRGAA